MTTMIEKQTARIFSEKLYEQGLVLAVNERDIYFIDEYFKFHIISKDSIINYQPIKLKKELAQMLEQYQLPVQSVLEAELEVEKQEQILKQKQWELEKAKEKERIEKKKFQRERLLLMGTLKELARALKEDIKDAHALTVLSPRNLDRTVDLVRLHALTDGQIRMTLHFLGIENKTRVSKLVKGETPTSFKLNTKYRLENSFYSELMDIVKQTFNFATVTELESYACKRDGLKNELEVETFFEILIPIHNQNFEEMSQKVIEGLNSFKTSFCKKK